MRVWGLEFQEDGESEAMLGNLADPARVRIDRFLIDSIVFEDIEAPFKKDVPVPRSKMVGKYLRASGL